MVDGGWWISYFERLWVVVPVVSVSNGERSIFGGSPASRSKNVESSSQKNFETKGTRARLRRTNTHENLGSFTIPQQEDSFKNILLA